MTGDENSGNSNKASALEVYKLFVAREKSLYHALNNMRQGASTHIGFFWAPIADEEMIREKL